MLKPLRRGLAAPIALALAALSTVPAAAADLPRLKVSDNRRFLVDEGGKPFFYLADTAWELFHRLDREEAERYLRNRADKGFTVIQAVALAELDGLHTPNPYGETPLIDDDPARPNDAYFRHVDFVVDRANALGLYIGLLPTWGDKVNKKWGVGPVVFNPENARAYGEFLGRRYGGKGIIWILGGDRPIEEPVHRAIWDAMAAGIKAGDGGRNLITYHPMGGQSSSQYVHDADWLDFQMLQSGHGHRDTPNDRMLLEDYRRTPTRPCIDGEPNYEDHPIGFKAANGKFPTVDIRKAAYRGLFAGAFGHTYGCHDIWQFWEKGRQPITAADTPWTEAMDLPGAGQMQHARRLIESRPFLSRVPDPDLIVDNPPPGPDHGQACKGDEGRYAFVYIPTGKPTTVDLERLAGPELRGWWFDPRTGRATEIGPIPREGRHTFTPPTRGDDQDWVLVLDASPDYGPPGLRR